MSSRFVSSPLKIPALLPSSSSSHVRYPALAFSSYIDLHLKVLSGPQTPASAVRGAESDVMGLLLRERIVFLGTSVDDFVADAIIIDAMDPTKDIRLFITYSCGSLSFLFLQQKGGIRHDRGGYYLGFVEIQPLSTSTTLLRHNQLNYTPEVLQAYRGC